MGAHLGQRPACKRSTPRSVTWGHSSGHGEDGPGRRGNVSQPSAPKRGMLWELWEEDFCVQRDSHQERAGTGIGVDSRFPCGGFWDELRWVPLEQGAQVPVRLGGGAQGHPPHSSPHTKVNLVARKGNGSSECATSQSRSLRRVNRRPLSPRRGVGEGFPGTGVPDLSPPRCLLLLPSWRNGQTALPGGQQLSWHVSSGFWTQEILTILASVRDSALKADSRGWSSGCLGAAPDRMPPPGWFIAGAER